MFLFHTVKKSEKPLAESSKNLTNQACLPASHSCRAWRAWTWPSRIWRPTSIVARSQEPSWFGRGANQDPRRVSDRLGGQTMGRRKVMLQRIERATPRTRSCSSPTPATGEGKQERAREGKAPYGWESDGDGGRSRRRGCAPPAVTSRHRAATSHRRLAASRAARSPHARARPRLLSAGLFSTWAFLRLGLAAKSSRPAGHIYRTVAYTSRS
jgi:hypothetical protein